LLSVKECKSKGTFAAYERFKFSARSFHKSLRVSRTFADLEGSVDKINECPITI
jgi:predicted ATPase with chaperone activity